MDWQTLTKDERAALSRASTAERRTLVERWSEPQDEVSRGRAERMRIAASFVPPGAAVADIGCASMQLERFLPPGTRYIPVDVVARDPRTVVVDLNLARLPPLGADVVVVLGVLEYLNDVPGFVQQLQSDAIVSYAPYDLMPDRDRAASGWKNSYTTTGLGGLFERSGFAIRDLVPSPGKHMIWNLKRAW